MEIGLDGIHQIRDSRSMETTSTVQNGGFTFRLLRKSSGAGWDVLLKRNRVSRKGDSINIPRKLQGEIAGYVMKEAYRLFRSQRGYVGGDFEILGKQYRVMFSQ